MKLSIAIADTNALPSAFVVYRGFEQCIPKAANLGFHGVELALKRASEINVSRLHTLLTDHHIEVSCISTGQVFADGGLTITHKDANKRKEVKRILTDLIDLAEEFGQAVNFGRVRGSIGNQQKEYVEDLFLDAAKELSEYALKRNVTLLLEPVNRYEIDFINTVESGVSLMKKINMPNMKLMPDIFHMNIEDVTIAGELKKNIEYVGYIHFADSNRLAPGWGHLDFDEIFSALLVSGYNGWITAEILPDPDPDSAALQVAKYLLPYVKKHNLNLMLKG